MAENGWGQEGGKEKKINKVLHWAEALEKQKVEIWGPGNQETQGEPVCLLKPREGLRALQTAE